jgi:hypothetical protein
MKFSASKNEQPFRKTNEGANLVCCCLWNLPFDCANSDCSAFLQVGRKFKLGHYPAFHPLDFAMVLA